MKLAIIGGSGTLELFECLGGQQMTTPYGAPSARPERIRIGDRELWYLARHGRPHRIPPHRINYRANIHALKTLGVGGAIAINAVGGIDPALKPGKLVIADQLIDYTWGREHTFSDGGSSALRYVDFTHPFEGRVRAALLEAARAAGLGLVDKGCYAAVQGPRLETASEIRRLARDGCTIVGMTGMPEAGLAREAGLDYATICVVANPAAGVAGGALSEQEIYRNLEGSMEGVMRLLEATVPRIS